MKLSFFPILAYLTAFVQLPLFGVHPVPQRQHDRVIVVRPSWDANARLLRVRVDYRLEVDEFTVVFEDLPKLISQEDYRKLKDAQGFYTSYLKAFAPILGSNLNCSVGQRQLEFACMHESYALRDEKNEPLGHLRCDFVFESVVTLAEAPKDLSITFREANFATELGRIRLSIVSDATLQLEQLDQPSTALQEKPLIDLKPGEEPRLRVAKAVMSISGKSQPTPIQSTTESEPTPVSEANLLTLLLDTRRGFVVLLLLAAGFGAVHALTPGHGKTLVAAYLVGERGTSWHAVLLGIVTTVTHTGAVLLIAALLPLFFPKAPPRDIEMGLKLVGGLLIAGLGLWLLLRRLSGGSDHVHLPGVGHHHHGDGHHHHHAIPDGNVSIWGLVVLGISGGIIPCWDAIVMLGLAISAQRLWLGLPLLLAFSAGLASVLVIIGLAVVRLKGFASSRMGEGRIVKALPIASAFVVTVLGLWLCYDSVQGSPVGTLTPTP